MPISLPTQYTFARRQCHRVHRHAQRSAGLCWRWPTMAWRAERHCIDKAVQIHHLVCPADSLQHSGAQARPARSTALVYINVHIDTLSCMHTYFKINKLEHVCC